MPEDRRHPRRPFDPALIVGYLQGRALVSAALLPLGKSHTNYKLTLSDGEVCVLRLHNPATNPAREAAILDLVKGVVPVPTVLASGADWSIHSFLDGTILADAPEGTRSAAEALARLAALRFPSAGWIEADRSVTPFDFGNGRSFLEATLDRADVAQWIGRKAVDALRAMEARWNAEARPGEEACLVHGDFNPSNILVQGGVITAVLDWEFAHAGDRYMDIGNLLRHTDPALHGEIEAGFADGGLPLPGDWKRRAEGVDLGAHLEFLTTGRSDAFKRECVDWVHRYVERYC